MHVYGKDCVTRVSNPVDSAHSSQHRYPNRTCDRRGATSPGVPTPVKFMFKHIRDNPMLFTSYRVNSSVTKLIKGRQARTKPGQPQTERDTGRTPEAGPPRQTDAAERQ